MSAPDGIAEAVRLIERRVEQLEDELHGPYGQASPPQSQACDRSAILEARHLADLLRALGEGPYEGHPLDVARGRTGHGRKVL